jgi:CheY-like chemotaxis protein
MSEDQKILIVDDDVDFCCLFQLAFHEVDAGNSVEAIHDGRSAVSHLRQLTDGNRDAIIPGLILLDLRMPEVSGLDVLRWIRSQSALSHVPVVVFTGLEGGKELAQSVALGATAVREKPFSYRELIHEAKELRDTYLETRELRHAA